MTTHVSVIIPSFGAAPHLTVLLNAIENGSQKPTEIIVSHSGPSDPTDDLGKLFTQVKVLHSDERLLAGAARNRGAEAAGGTVLAFCDSDVRPVGEWLEELLRCIEKDKNRFVVGSVGTATSGGYWGMSNWLCEFSEQAPWRAPGVQTGGASCNMAVRRIDFFRAGAFDTALQPGEDTLLFRRLRQMGLEQRFAPSARVDHFNNSGFRSFYRHQLTLGAGFSTTRRSADLSAASAIRIPPLALALWLAKAAVVTRRVLSAGPSGVARAAAYLPGIVIGSLVWNAGCVAGLLKRDS